MQLELAASVAPHAFVPVPMEKSVGLVPVMLGVMPVIAVVVLLLASVAIMGGLVWLEATPPKANGEGVRVAVRVFGVPVPLRNVFTVP